MSDGYVQVAQDGTGKKIDNSELTRADGTVVERQRVAIGDDLDPTQQARVRDGGLQVEQSGYVRRLAELAYIEQLEANARILGANELYGSERRGVELR